jgi:putative ABC transport system permease protein
MVQNFLKIAFRNLWKQKSSTLINIIGLSIGLSASLIIFLFVFNELKYDSFHKNGKNIYRVYQNAMIDGKEDRAAWTPVPMAPELRSVIPEVLNVVRLVQLDNVFVSADQKYFNIKHSLYVDSTFFEVFSFGLLHGDVGSVLSEPRSVVLTRSSALKIFGTEDPVNKLIRFESDTNYFRVTGISQDPPENSHFEFEMLISMDAYWDKNSTNWMSNNVNTYVLLPDKYPFKNIENKFPELILKYFGPQVKKVLGVSLEELGRKGTRLEYKLQPLLNIHLDTSLNQGLKPSANKKYIYIFSLVGIFIILIAVINFINLSTARFTRRAREVGLSKVFGSSRKKLIIQFLSESIIISFISMVIAFSFFGIMLPYTNRMTDMHLSLSIFNPLILITIITGCSILIGILAGFYPAFLLSSYDIISILKNKNISGGKGRTVRRILVIVQYLIAIVILSGTLVVHQQLKFIQNKDLGFDKSNLMVIGNTSSINSKIKAFMEEIKKIPGIINVTNSTSIPGFPNSDNGFMVEGGNHTGTFVLYSTWVDYSFINTLKLKITQGREFMNSFSSDSAAVIINEAAVKKMELKNPIGTRLMNPDATGKFTYYTIIGVAKDFHFQNLHKTIEPCVLLVKPKKMSWTGYISIRLDKGEKSLAINKIEETWKQFTGSKPIGYSFLDDDLLQFYKEEKQTANLSATFTMIAIFIACLGLFGLISFNTVQRTKEIGIRKIMGASVKSILVLLSSETIKLIIISSLLAWPVAWIFLKNWLEGFAFRIGLNPIIFLLTSLIILSLSLLTICGQVWFSATRNPVDALRYE